MLKQLQLSNSIHACYYVPYSQTIIIMIEEYTAVHYVVMSPAFHQYIGLIVYIHSYSNL